MALTLKDELTDSMTKPARSRKIFTAAVQTTGNQSIAGVKTFTASPVVPAPTTNLQASTKKYVDDGLASAVTARNTAIAAEATARDAAIAAVIMTVKVALTAAQIKAVKTGAIELIAAPGAGKLIKLLSPIVMNYKYGAAPFTDAGGACLIKLGANAVHTIADLSTLIVAGAAAITMLQLKDSVAISANTALTISKATNDFAAGDGTIDFLIHYAVVTL